MKYTLEIIATGNPKPLAIWRDGKIIADVKQATIEEARTIVKALNEYHKTLETTADIFLKSIAKRVNNCI